MSTSPVWTGLRWALVSFFVAATALAQPAAAPTVPASTASVRAPAAVPPPAPPRTATTGAPASTLPPTPAALPTPRSAPAPVEAPAPRATPAPAPHPLAPPAALAPHTAASTPDASSPAPSASAEPAPAASAEPVAPMAPTEPVAPLPAPSSAPPAPSAHALPSAASAPAPTPAPSASAAHLADASVKLGDAKVFVLRVPRGGKTAEQRAQAATAALAAASEKVHEDEVRFEHRGEIALVLAGQTPIVELGLEDATAAGASSLDVHAATVVAALKTAIESEHRQAALSKTVFSISLLVFLGLIAFYLMQKIGEFAERARLWIDANAERVLAVRVQQIEVVSPGTVRSTALVVLGAGRWVAQVGVFYAWLMVVLSLFDATRGYTEKLTGLIVTPLSQLMTRLATGLPVLAVLIIAGFAVFVLVRFLGLFFDSIERRENTVTWLTPDLAAPTSALLRFGVVLSALVFLAPLVTGNTEGVLGRTGAVALVALGLASTPVLATGLLGSIVLFGRRLRPGQHVEVGAFAGRISSIGLLELRLEDAERAEVRIPHLYSLRHPTRVLGVRPRIGVEIPVGAGSSHAEVQGLLLGVASRFGDDARVELLHADADCALFRVTLASEQRNARSELQLAIVEALGGAHVPLGRLGHGARS